MGGEKDALLDGSEGVPEGVDAGLEVLVLWDDEGRSGRQDGD